MTKKEISKAVMIKYPKTERERQGCPQEIERNNELRKLYKQRLEQTGTTEVIEGS